MSHIFGVSVTDGAYVKDHEEAASVHYLVLTDISGERSYAVCITMYQAYNVRRVSYILPYTRPI